MKWKSLGVWWAGGSGGGGGKHIAYSYRNVSCGTKIDLVLSLRFHLFYGRCYSFFKCFEYLYFNAALNSVKVTEGKSC